MRFSCLLFLCSLFGFSGLAIPENDRVVFFDDFKGLPRGAFNSEGGAHTEYHFLHEAMPKGNWALSTFTSGSKQNSWQVRDENGDRIIYQVHSLKPGSHTHPMLVAGDDLWGNYTLEVVMLPAKGESECGVAFRYKNDRCYYFFGIIGEKIILKLVNHETGFHKPNETILDEKPFVLPDQGWLKAKIGVNGGEIRAKFEGGPELTAKDTTFTKGKIGLIADLPTKYTSVKVAMSSKGQIAWETERKTFTEFELGLQFRNPKPVVWKKIATPDFGTGRNLRFGDLNNDGVIDLLIGQDVNHGLKDRNTELSCLTAMTFDGKILWQKGVPDPWKTMLTCDVAFQIHDIDHDGKSEVIYTMNQVIYVADGATGKVRYSTPTPLTPGKISTTGGNNGFERILGDCLYFCDLQGKGYNSDMILKDRYNFFWVYDDKLNVRWTGACKTGHYPCAADSDNDGKDELLIGYSLFDDDGKLLWSLDKEMEDHADGVAIVDMAQNGKPEILCAASDEGMFFADLKGNILKHHYIGHVQNPTVANFRDDLPGLEVVSVNFWGNQGIIHFYDSKGDIYYSFEPNQFGSLCLPVNWTGRSEEFFLHNPNVDLGGMFDGWGRKVVVFPDDGHPDMCNAVLDVTGDGRDEIIVWDPNEIWIYTQDDNPQRGKLYHPDRNKRYNESNYQAIVSTPGWSNDPDAKPTFTGSEK
jgi:hypothetical protein